MTGIEKRKIKLSRRFRLFLTASGFTLFIFFSWLIYFSLQLEPIVGQRLKETVKTSTNGLYDINFSDIHLNPFTGSVKFDNIVFSANDKVYKSLKKRNLHPTHIYLIKIKSLALKRVHPIKVYFNRDLHLKTLHIESPTIKVYFQKPRDENNEPEDKRTTWQRLSKYLKSIKIEDIILDNIDFQYIDKSSGKSEIDGVKNLSININDLLIDSLSEKDPTRFYFTKEIFVKIRDHEYQSRNKLYDIHFNELTISSSKKYAFVKGLLITPRYPEMTFFNYLKERKARMDIKLNGAILQNIDFKRLITKRQLRASSLTFINSTLNVFLDLRNKKPEYDRGINFPQLALKRLSLNTFIDTVRIQNSSIAYSEYTPITGRRGRIFFNKINGEIFNFTNDSLQLKKAPWVKANLSLMFYGKAKLGLNMNFNLASATNEYNYSGNLSAINAKNFNLLSRPLALLRINSGKIIDARFSVKADYRKSEGKLLMKYKDLNIGLLRIDSNKVLHKQMLRSLVANNVLLREDNPATDGTLRVGRIRYERPDSVAFFGNLWQSIYSGLRETIGLSPERERELINQFRSFNHQKSSVERDHLRDVRRDRRKVRREMRGRD